MNEAIQKILFTLVRALLLWLLGLLAAKSPQMYGIVQLFIGGLGGSEALVLSIVGATTVALIAAISRLRSRIEFLTALELPPGTNEQSVKDNASNQPLKAAFRKSFK